MASVNPTARPAIAPQAMKGAATVPPIGAAPRPTAASPRATLTTAAGAATKRPAGPATLVPGPQLAAPKLAAATLSPRTGASAATPSPAPAPTAILGDIDGDGRVGEADGRALLDYLFSGGAAPADLAQADINADGRVDIADAMQMLAAENAAPGLPAAPLAPVNTASPFLLRQAAAGYQRSAVPTALKP